MLVIPLVSVIYLIISAFLFYRRILFTVHNNIFCEYLEISPFFTLSIVIFVHLYTSKYGYVFLTIFIVHVVLILFLLIFHQYLARESFRFYNAIKKGDDVVDNNYILPGNIVSVLRQITMHSGDPSVFMIVLAQRQYNVKASPMLEIIRFLSLYPSKRNDMITELSQIKSSSNYNRFIIYFFIKVLKSLTSVSDEKHTANLDELQRSFLVHNHMYWKSREKKKYFSSFKEACATSYYFIETKFELMGLIERFPFDSYLYTRYADFALIGGGDFEQYQKSMMISADLEKDRNLITDPILHRTIKNNVRVLQFCNTEETIGSLPVRNSHSSNENDVPVASYVKKSKRMIPFLPFLHIFCSIILLLVFFILSSSFESNIQDRFKDLNSISSSLDFLYKKAAFSIMFQYSNSSSIDDPSVCQESINEMQSSLSNFFVGLPQIQFLYNYSVIFFNDYFLENMKSGKTICQCLNNLTFASYCLSMLYLNELDDQFNLITQQMNDINKRINDKKHDFLHEIIIIAVYILITIIYVIILFVQVNWIFREKTNVIKFLASKKRISSLLLEQCLESWENLYNYIQSRQLSLLHLHSKNPNSKIPDLSLYNSSSSMISNSDYSSYYESPSYSITSTDLSESTMINEEESHDYSISSDSKNDRSNKKMMNSTIESNDSNININENVDKNIEQSFAENNEIEEDPIELAIESTKKQEPFAWLIAPFCVVIPYIISVLVILFLIIPTKFRVKFEEEIIDDYIDNCFQINTTFNLIKNTYYLLNGIVNYSSLFYENVYNSIIQKKTNITDIFTRYQCLQLQEIVCTSFDSLVIEIGSSPPSHNDILFLYLPAFIDFGVNAISATFSYTINPYSQILTTSTISFFVDFGFVCIYSIYISFLYGFYLLSSFNSLYHFPETLIKKKKGKKRSHNNEIINSENINRTNYNTNNDIKDKDATIPILPSTVLKVVSVIAFDEIYSISENAGVILNRPVPLFIGEKFSEVFPPIQYNDQLNDQINKDSIISYSNYQTAANLREHLMPDHVKKKIFRSSSQIRGEFLITLLIEDEFQSVIKSAYKKESISERLMNYVPVYFAKVFTESNINELTIDYPILIFLRYDISKSQADLDRFFSTINTSIMNYTAFKILKADSGIFLFCSIKKINQFISYLFIRDIISESANFSKAQPTRAPLTVYVESFDSLNVSLNTDLEPCLEIGFDKINEYEALLYNIGNYQVAFKGDFFHPIDTIDEVSQREQILLDRMSRSIKKLSFDKYIELFKKYL